MPKRKRPVTYTSDCRGDLVHVSLGNTADEAVLDRADFERIIAEGYSDQWVANDNGCGKAYIKTRSLTKPYNAVHVPRLILKITAGKVGYRNGCRWDLRRSNLCVKVKYVAAPRSTPFQPDSFKRRQTLWSR